MVMLSVITVRCNAVVTSYEVMTRRIAIKLCIPHHTLYPITATSATKAHTLSVDNLLAGGSDQPWRLIIGNGGVC